MKRSVSFFLTAALLADAGFAQGSDSCATAQALSAGAGMHAYDLSAATTDGVGDPGCLAFGQDDITRDVWFAWQPSVTGFWSFTTCGDPSDTKLAIYDMQACPPVAPIACQDDACATQSDLIASVVAGSTYLLRVGTYPLAATGSAGNLTITSLGAGPMEDNCATPGIVPSPVPQLIPADITLGSTDGTPDASCLFFGTDQVYGDHWFTWTAPATGTFLLSTCAATTVDTKLAVYTGAGCPSAAPIACFDDACGLQTALSFSATTGSAYTFRVGHFPAYPGGPMTISLDNAITNDLCSGAQALMLGPNAVDTTGTTASGIAAAPLPPYVDNVTPDTACQEFGNGADDLHNDAWYAFVPPAGGNYLFSTCNMNGYDTKLALYSGTCNALTPLACNDDGNGCNLGSELRATGLVPGTAYLVQVGSFGAAAQGTATLDISQEVGGGVGTSFCQSAPNSVTPMGGTTGALITGSGSNSVSANDLVLTASPMPPGEPGIFFYGSSVVNSGNGIAFGNGFRCAGGTVVRFFPPVQADALGNLTRSIDNTLPAVTGSMAPIVPTATMHFQGWYRDPDAGGPGFNLSDGLSITFAP